MIKTLYYYDLKKALRASFENRYACYINEQTNAKCWLSKGCIIYFENPDKQPTILTIKRHTT